MIYKIGNVKGMNDIPALSDNSKSAISKFTNILSAEYGENRDIDHDYGGYVLYATPGTTIDDIKKHFNYEEFILEYAELFGNDICAAIYLTSTEYAVVLIMSVDDAPDVIIGALPKAREENKIVDVNFKEDI